MSDIRFNQWLHNSGTGGVSQVDGGHVGIGTTNPLIPVGAGNTSILNVGVVTANSYYGSGANLTGISGVSVANQADNRLITATGTTDALNAESGLTYNGTSLGINDSSGNAKLIVSGNSDTSDADCQIRIYDTDSTAGSKVPSLSFWGSVEQGRIRGTDTAGLKFYTHDGSSLTEKLNVGATGHMGLGVQPNANWPTNADFKALQIGTGFCAFGRGSGDEDRGGIAANWYSTGSANKYIGNGNAARIYLADGNIYFSNAGANSSGADAAMTLNDRMIIDSAGRLKLGTTTEGAVSANNFTIAASGYCGMTIRSGTSSEGNIFFSDATSGSGESAGIVRYEHNNDSMVFKVNGGERLRINSNGDVTTTGATSFVRSNAGFTARAGDSVGIARANGTPLEISRTGNDGQMINFFRDSTGVAQITWDGSNLTMGPQADPDVLKIGSTITATAKFNVDYTVSGSDYIALFRNNNANSYGVQIKEPSSVNTGYPLLSISNNAGGSHFRVDTAGQVYANSGAGTDKKAYFVRAWVNFDGQGGSAGQNRSIQDSQNVSSVYDNDSGDFTINFTTNMPTSAYAICGMASNWEATNADSYMITSAYKNTTYVGSCRIRTIRARFDQHPPQFRDSNETMIAIIC